MNFNKRCSLALRQLHHHFFRLIFIAALAGLTACGGGGSSTTSTENDLPSPVAGGIDGEVLTPGPDGKTPVPPFELALLPSVSVGPRQFADPNVLLNLRGTVVAAEGAQIAKTLWTQVTGPSVRIPRPTALDNVILMPEVSIATTLEFRLTAEDSAGRVNSATVSVLVKPVPTFVKVSGGYFNETDQQATFAISLNAPSDVPVSVSYITQDGTASGETDYLFVSDSLVFEPGEVRKEIVITLIDDVLAEDDETFTLQATAVSGEATYANTGVAIIIDGVELLPQTIQFSDAGPLAIVVGGELTNALDPEVPQLGTGAVVYVSSNPAVASVDATGSVVGLTLGSTIITAVKAADDVYLAAEASYRLDVVTDVIELLPQSIQFTNAGPVTLIIGDESINPLDSAVSSPGTGAIAFVSSNPAVAAVDVNGIVMGVSVGTATITAVKAADAVYLAAEASYQVQVVIRGTVPTVQTEEQDGYSVASGEPINLYGMAEDAEDGPLPTQAEINAFNATGTPITSVRWDSSIDGFLGNGFSLSEVGPLSDGIHTITYSVTDSDNNVGTASFDLFVGNIAPMAFTSASSTFSGYAPARINDSNISTALGGAASWTNANGTLPGAWVALSWSTPVTISRVRLYSTEASTPGESFIIRDYDIEYLDGNNWIKVVVRNGNRSLIETHSFAQITTNGLRVLVRRGPDYQPNYARVNELVVIGTVPTSVPSFTGVR